MEWRKEEEDGIEKKVKAAEQSCPQQVSLTKNVIQDDQIVTNNQWNICGPINN